MSNEVELNKANEELLNIFPTQIFLKRIAAYKLPFAVSDFFFVISLLTFGGNPGDIMILLRLCYQNYLKTGKTFLGIKDWVGIFPFGTPSKEELEKMWDSQKYPLGNMIDNVEYWTERYQA